MPEDVVGKVEKLIALADDRSFASPEGQAAAVQACRLIAQHKLEIEAAGTRAKLETEIRAFVDGMRASVFTKAGAAMGSSAAAKTAREVGVRVARGVGEAIEREILGAAADATRSVLGRKGRRR